MALAHSPSIVMNGLVLCLDAGNTKSYDPNENLLTYSNDFSNSLWGGYCGNKGSIVYNTTDVLDPNGGYTATKIVKTVNVCDIANPAFGLIWNWGTVPIVNTTDTYTVSLYVRGAVGGETVVIGLADNRGQSYTLTTSWQRITYTGKNDNPSTDYNYLRSFQVASSGTNQTYYIWGAQLETGVTADPYYPTTTTAKTGSTSWNNISITSSITQYNATLTNGPSSSSLNGGTIYFDGTNDYAFAVDAPPVNFFTSWTQQITIESWINYISSGTNRGIVVRGSAGSNSHGLIFSSSNTVSAYFRDGGGNVSQATSTVSPNTWYHLTAVWTGSTAILYVNGSLASSSSTPSLSGNTSTGVAFQIGRYGSFGYLNAYISGTKIYDRALSASEISQNFNALRGRFRI